MKLIIIKLIWGSEKTYMNVYMYQGLLKGSLAHQATGMECNQMRFITLIKVLQSLNTIGLKKLSTVDITSSLTFQYTSCVCMYIYIYMKYRDAFTKRKNVENPGQTLYFT